MSGDDKNFLSRWSQRKQEAKQPEPEPPVDKAEAPPAPAAEVEQPSRNSTSPACRNWRS